MRKRSIITDEEKNKLCDDYLNGAYISELANAYGISEARVYAILQQKQKAYNFEDEETLDSIRKQRAEARSQHTYPLDADVDEWLRQQKDIGKVLNYALRLAMIEQKKKKRKKNQE